MSRAMAQFSLKIAHLPFSMGPSQGGKADFANFDPPKSLTSGRKNLRTARSASCKMDARVFMVFPFL